MYWVSVSVAGSLVGIVVVVRIIGRGPTLPLYIKMGQDELAAMVDGEW
jgi:hypothetical protein